MKTAFKLGTLCISIIAFFLFCSMGGGTIVNNPAIMGYVKTTNNRAANGAMVILAREGAINTNDTAILTKDDIIIVIETKTFDTAYCDMDGYFKFDSIFPGNYCLVSLRNGMSAIESVVHGREYDSKVDLLIEESAQLTIYSRTLNTADTVRFTTAYITGTVFKTDPDSSGSFIFTNLPSGDVNIALLKNNKEIVYYNKFTTMPGISASMTADPHRSENFWVAKESGIRDPIGRPYIIWSSPENGASGSDALVNSGELYDVAIQFSHPMDTRKTSKAVSAVSSDTKTVIDSLWWQGADVVYIRLCTKDTFGNCTGRDSLYSSGVRYSVVIDTSAETGLGVKYSFPDTVSFIPKP